jgi:thiamine biosynthesis lipoprotein
MGLPFRIVLYARDEVVARRVAELAFARLSELNSILSDYDDHSELSRLSRSSATGAWVALSDDLWRVLARGQELARRSDGAFDVTVGPLVQLWRRARRQRQLPASDRLAEARRVTGWQRLELDAARRRARLTVPGMRLDLGGIAKGYAVQEALRFLETRGFPCALVSGGGDLAAGEPPPGQRGWRVELAPLEAPGAPPVRYASLRGGALATSGDVFQYVEIEGVRYSHILDPRTGLGLTDHSLVTVFAPDGMTADGLATAVSVLGPVAGLRLLGSEPGVEGRIIREVNGEIEVRETPGLKKRLFRETRATGTQDSVALGPL